jgi:hypothetical protein
VANEQLLPQAILQQPNALADGGLGHAQLITRRRKA